MIFLCYLTFYFNRSGPGYFDLVSAINDVNNGVARGAFLLGGEINEKEGVGNIMEAVVGSADKMAMWSNQIYQEEGNQKEPFIFTVDQYLESVEIFIQSLSPEIESGNNVSKQAPTGHGSSSPSSLLSSLLTLSFLCPYMGMPCLIN